MGEVICVVSTPQAQFVGVVGIVLKRPVGKIPESQMPVAVVGVAASKSTHQRDKTRIKNIVLFVAIVWIWRPRLLLRSPHVVMWMSNGG